MKFNHRLNTHVQAFVELKKTERLWHFPLLAGLCVGLCLWVGWFFDWPAYGNLSSIGALVILYFTQATLSKRMVHLCVCAFGFSISFALGYAFSFSHILSAIALGLIAFLSHLITSWFDVPPPRNFFFIMIGAVATSIPIHPEAIPLNVGLVSMGAMLSVLLALFYSVFVAKRVVEPKIKSRIKKKRYTELVASFIIGFAMFLGLMIGHWLELKSAYWIPVSALAILQGKDLFHAWQRNLHRIIGTFIGIGITWVMMLSTAPSGVELVFLIAGLQFIVEMLVVRNYGLAVIFITPLTIFLAENASGLHTNVNELMEARILDTVIGSLIGVLAGWFLHDEFLTAKLEKQFRSVEILLHRK